MESGTTGQCHTTKPPCPKTTCCVWKGMKLLFRSCLFQDFFSFLTAIVLYFCHFTLFSFIHIPQSSLLFCNLIFQAGHYLEVDGITCLNLATHNYLSLADKPEIEEEAVKSIRKYGVGSCGPRGFYGTVGESLSK